MRRSSEQAHLYSNVRVQEEKPSKKQLKLSCHPVEEGDWAQTPARAGTGQVSHFAAGAGNLYTSLVVERMGTLEHAVQGNKKETVGEQWSAASEEWVETAASCSAQEGEQ